MKRMGKVLTALSLTMVAGAVFAAKPPMNYDGSPGGVKLLEQGQRPAVVYPSVEAQQLQLRADELAAGMDAWTGGWFSRAIGGSAP